MAFVRDEYCRECCKDTVHTNGKCNNCGESEAKKKHRDHFAKLDKMTLEERVREIEKQLYNLNNNPPWGGNIFY